MATPSTNCPDCNSVQRFARRRRVSIKDPDSVQIYIECFACGYERVIESVHRAEETANKRRLVRRNREIKRQLRSR